MKPKKKKKELTETQKHYIEALTQMAQQQSGGGVVDDVNNSLGFLAIFIVVLFAWLVF